MEMGATCVLKFGSKFECLSSDGHVLYMLVWKYPIQQITFLSPLHLPRQLKWLYNTFNTDVFMCKEINDYKGTAQINYYFSHFKGSGNTAGYPHSFFFFFPSIHMKKQRILLLLKSRKRM